ncbi:MAG: RNA pyrophosphohydrolase [Deltaproteobacteria bacterium]|nr:RNA pyrophosphohydrolase [Deltaproteobacteria bacterium]
MNSELPYRSCVGITLFNQDKKVLVAERLDYPGNWQMPQGGIDSGETPAQAAMRELKEEIGTNHAEIMERAKGWLFYDLPEHLKGERLKGKYRGQKQIWFAMLFKGNDSEINLQTKKPEFIDWNWVELENVIDLIVPFKKTVYESVVEQFRPIVESKE